MTYRWEPTTPLDRILATGFKCMDEAVEGVIERLAPEPVIAATAESLGRELEALVIDGLRESDERFRNQMARNEMAEMARMQAGTQGAYELQNQLLNRMGQNTQGGLFGPATSDLNQLGSAFGGNWI